MNTVPFGDFFRKCHQLGFRELAEKIRVSALPNSPLKKTEDGRPPTFEEVVRLLHKTFGGNYRALEFLQQSLKIRQEIGDINGVAITLTNMGAMLFEQERYEEAVPLFVQAYQIFEKIGSPNKKAPEGYLGAIIKKIEEARFGEIMKGR